LMRLPLSLPALAFSLLLNIGAAPAIWAAILATGRIPDWLFEYQVRVGRWHTQTAAYLLLLDGSRPVFDGEHPVGYTIGQPRLVSRWKLVVWKALTTIPHALVLVGLIATLVPLTIVGWIFVVTTGRYPRPLHNYSAGTVRWLARVLAYLQSLTDEYPPFSFEPTAGPASLRSYRVSSLVGLVAMSPLVAFAAFMFYIIGFTGTHVTTVVSYDGLLTHDAAAGTAAATVESGRMQLVSASDPADRELVLFRPDGNARFVAFTISIENRRGAGETVDVVPGSFRLEVGGGRSRSPVLVGVDGWPGSGSIAAGTRGMAVIVFDVAETGAPVKLVWDVVDYIAVPRRGETIEWIFR